MQKYDTEYGKRSIELKVLLRPGAELLHLQTAAFLVILDTGCRVTWMYW